MITWVMIFAVLGMIALAIHNDNDDPPRPA
jgi:hypothetical protein